MFLFKAKRVKDITARQLVCVDSYLEYLERPDEYKDIEMIEWCGVDISEVDMSLVDDYRCEYVDSDSIYEEVAYWRKRNHIHKWFVDNVQNGEDDCDYYEVTREQLEKLLEVCKEVMSGFASIESLLPTTSGFFFGSTDYDEWYFNAVEYTIEAIQDVLNTTDFENEMIMYHASW